eukprot:TRINITY_DN0_c2161_g1_i6.p1 TRINITY_DN0_c2161_g1~~TRINITY_DN0_c2161_g1_i6.p1  ORF type:complete len:124 (-),score=17.58 TRINITY_DN0_c2161_g1_i6:112-483(-)
MDGTYGINFFPRINQTKKLLLFTALPQATFSDNFLPNLAHMLPIPPMNNDIKDINKDSNRTPDTSDGGQDKIDILVKSKNIYKLKTYHICTIKGCSRSYYSEKRLKRHMVHHFKTLYDKTKTE